MKMGHLDISGRRSNGAPSSCIPAPQEVTGRCGHHWRESGDPLMGEGWNYQASLTSPHLALAEHQPVPATRFTFWKTTPFQ
jgi:hypothetical protein